MGLFRFPRIPNDLEIFSFLTAAFSHPISLAHLRPVRNHALAFFTRSQPPTNIRTHSKSDSNLVFNIQTCLRSLRSGSARNLHLPKPARNYVYRLHRLLAARRAVTPSAPTATHDGSRFSRVAQQRLRVRVSVALSSPPPPPPSPSTFPRAPSRPLGLLSARHDSRWNALDVVNTCALYDI